MFTAAAIDVKVVGASTAASFRVRGKNWSYANTYLYFSFAVGGRSFSGFTVGLW
jgi:hypothetical protein